MKDEPLPAVPSRLINVEGTHCYADLYDCKCDIRLLTDADYAESLMRERILGAGFTILGELFHKFDPLTDEQTSGYTGMFVLAESHFSVHSWSDEKFISMDLYTCNVSRDNSQETRDCFHDFVTWFKAEVKNVRVVKRGLKYAK